MLVRRIAALLAATCLLSACATAPHAKTIGGGAIAATGVALMMHRADGHCEPQGDTAADICDAVISEPVNALADAVSTLFGLGLVVLGGGLVIDGLHDFEEERDAKLEEESQIVNTPPVNPFAGMPDVQDDAEAQPLPAQAVILDRVENRLAVQASLIARSGNCTSAIVTANELAKRDPAMFANLLAADADLKGCYDAAPAVPQPGN